MWKDLAGCVGIVFLVLKLCDLIDWSWWVVLLPFYGVASIILIFGLAALFFKFVCEKIGR